MCEMLKSKLMRVGLDGQALVGEIPTGFGIYTRLLERSLSEMQARGELEYLVFKPKNEKKPLRSVAQRLLWERVSLPFEVTKARRSLGINLFHSPCLGAPYPLSIPLVVTVHDLILLKNPPLGAFARYYFTRIVPAGWRRASLIICDSETVRAELLEFSRLKEEQVKVVHLYSRFESKEGANLNLPAEKSRVPYKFLVVSSLERRKNLELVLKAFAMLPQSLRDHCLLQVAGLELSSAAGSKVLSEQLQISGRVQFLGYLREHDLKKAYQDAFLLISASKEEGFDLPPLEAMSLGTPVLLSDIPVHREIYGHSMVLPTGVVGESSNSGGQAYCAGLSSAARPPFFFSPERPDELSNLFTLSIQDSSFYERLLDVAQSISSFYSSSRFQEGLLSAYLSCLQSSVS